MESLIPDRIDYHELSTHYKPLEKYLVKLSYTNEYDIDWKQEEAIITLNKAILFHYFHIAYWEIPKNTLIPRIPMRINYLKWAHQLIGTQKKDHIIALDIGVGANCIFPLLGHAMYKWTFICSELSTESIDNAANIIKQNKLQQYIIIRRQTDCKKILKGIIEKEHFDITICNPPFFSTKEDKTLPSPHSVCPISQTEECCEGGELGFISRYISESIQFKEQVGWFTSLIGRKMDLENICTYLEEIGTPVKYCTQVFHQGRNRRWGIAWSFNIEKDEGLPQKKKKLS